MSNNVCVDVGKFPPLQQKQIAQIAECCNGTVVGDLYFDWVIRPQFIDYAVSLCRMAHGGLRIQHARARLITAFLRMCVTSFEEGRTRELAELSANDLDVLRVSCKDFDRIDFNDPPASILYAC